MFIFYNAFRHSMEIQKAIFWKDTHKKKLVCLLSNTLWVEGLIDLGGIYLLLHFSLGIITYRFMIKSLITIPCS